MRSLLVLISVVCLATLAVAPPPSSQSFTLTGVVRDFWPCDGDGEAVAGCGTPSVSCGNCHVDFEGAITGDDEGVIDPVLPAHGRPKLKQSPASRTIRDFDNWYNDVQGVNMLYHHNITLLNRHPLCNTKDGDGVWDPCSPNVFSYIDGQFFPIDNRGFGNFADTNRNFHFTYVIHGRLTYSGPSDKIGVNSEDDFWLFVNNRLAIDLGGVHDKGSKKVNLGLDSLGLQKHQSYPFSIFFASRHTPASQFRLSTNVQMSCPYVDHCGICRGDGQSCCTYCDDGNPCTTEYCDVQSGRCIYEQKSCPSPNKCSEGICDPSNGQCTTRAVVCNDGDPCTDDNCLPASGCSFNPKICRDTNPCTTDSCSNGACVFTPISSCGCTTATCSPANSCEVASCQNGACVRSTVNCDDSNACTSDSCVSNGANPSCSHSAISCPAADICHVSYCDPATGCRLDPIDCNDNDACTVDSCDVAAGGCVHTPVQIPDDGNACIDTFCDPFLGIQSNEVTCLPKECTCDPEDGCQCPNWFEKLSDTEKGLGGAALALIVIGGAAGAAFLAFGGKKGYDFWAAKNLAMANVNTNPLYAEKPGSFDNPLYEVESTNV